MPSRLPPIVTVCRCARPCVIPTRFSPRASAQRAGRPTCRATQHTTACSGSAPNFAPKAPPTSGVMIRIVEASTPSRPASAPRVLAAPWFGIHAVSRPSASQTAAVARVSMGAGATRWLAIVWETTTSQPSNRPESNWSRSPNEAATFVPAAGNSGVPSEAASAMPTTAGRSS